MGGASATAPADATATVRDRSLDSGESDSLSKGLLSAEQRRDNLRHASAMLFGHGDIVGGDKITFAIGDREPISLLPLVSSMVDPVKYAFVEPDGWDKIREEFGNRRIIVLRAAAGQGKVAAAIRLLLSPPDRRTFNLDRTIALQDLVRGLEEAGRGALPVGAGFLLCEPADIRAGTLQQLEAILEPLDAKLVVTLAAGVPLTDPDLTSYLVALPEPRPQSELLLRHLTWRLQEDEEAAERILADSKIDFFIKEAFAADPSTKVAADLAVLISGALEGATVPIGLLEKRWAERTSEDFDIWFGGLADVRTRSLAIALSVLNGLPYENVVRAAELLSDRLDGPRENTGTGTEPPWRDPFRSTRREVLRRLRARIVPATVQGQYGPIPAEVIEYSYEGYAQAVLERVWREYQIHRDLLGWLKELADDRTEIVRIWAGTALGLLSTLAFDFVFGVALRPMIFDEDKFWLRNVVAYALRVPAADPKLRPVVENAIAPILTDSDLPIGQATAARVYGLSLGPANVGQALMMLERLAVIDDWRIARGIGESLADLILDDVDRNAARVLARVLGWLRKDDRKLAGVYVFLVLAGSLFAEPDRPAVSGRSNPAPGNTGSWPLLLLLADQRPHLRDTLIGMWREVLDSNARPEHTENILGSWADMAEADPHVRTSFAWMLAATPPVAGAFGPTERQVRHQITNWLAPDGITPRPKTAYAVKAALDARTGAR